MTDGSRFEEDVIDVAIEFANREPISDNATAKDVSSRIGIWLGGWKAYSPLSKRIDPQKLWPKAGDAEDAAECENQRLKLREWLDEVIKHRGPPDNTEDAGLIRDEKGVVMKIRLHWRAIDNALWELVSFPTRTKTGEVIFVTLWPSVRHFVAYASALIADPNRPWAKRLRLCKCRCFYTKEVRGRDPKRCAECAEAEEHKRDTTYNRNRWKEAKQKRDEQERLKRRAELLQRSPKDHPINEFLTMPTPGSSVRKSRRRAT